MSSMKRRELVLIVNAALELAEKSGPTTPESRAIIIAAAIETVYARPAPRLIPYNSPSDKFFPPRVGLPKLRA